jgi:hypothetical protein
LTQENGFNFSNLFSGQMMPMRRPIQRNKPAWQEKTTVETNDKFTMVKVYVHFPTLQFPNTSIFMQVTNVKGSCFCRFDSPDKFRSFVGWLQDQTDAVEDIYDKLRDSELKVNQQLAQFHQAMNAVEGLKEMQDNHE